MILQWEHLLVVQIFHRLLSKGFALCDPVAKRRKMTDHEGDSVIAGSSIERDDAVLGWYMVDVCVITRYHYATLYRNPSLLIDA